MRFRRLIVLACAAAVPTLIVAASSLGQVSAAPSNTSLPSISGSARDGSLLTASHGSWTGSPTSYAYAWERCDNAGGSCAAIGSATSKQYTATTADVGHRLRVIVTATNSTGSGTATSRATNIVAATGQAPKNTSAPSISGTVKEGSTMTVDHGGWSGTNPITYAYQWQRCDATGGNCANIAGATNTSYTATSADVGNVLRVNVTATNSKSAATATTPETGIVAPAATGTHAIAVSQVSLPNRLIVDGVKF